MKTETEDSVETKQTASTLPDVVIGKSVAVSADQWQPFESCPIGVRVLLLSASGDVTIQEVKGGNAIWYPEAPVGWLPLDVLPAPPTQEPKTALRGDNLSFADAVKIARGCHDYGGGHHSDGHMDAYQHGIQTVVQALEAAAKRGLQDYQVAVLHSVGTQATESSAASHNNNVTAEGSVPHLPDSDSVLAAAKEISSTFGLKFQSESLAHAAAIISNHLPPNRKGATVCKCGSPKDDPIHSISTEFQKSHTFEPSPSSREQEIRERRESQYGPTARTPRDMLLREGRMLMDIDYLLELIDQLRSENKQLLFDLRQANSWIGDVEEREAAVCPEDVGFDEYIQSLQRQLSEAQAEVEKLAHVIFHNEHAEKMKDAMIEATREVQRRLKTKYTDSQVVMLNMVMHELLAELASVSIEEKQ